MIDDAHRSLEEIGSDYKFILLLLVETRRFCSSLEKIENTSTTGFEMIFDVGLPDVIFNLIFEKLGAPPEAYDELFEMMDDVMPNNTIVEAMNFLTVARSRIEEDKRQPPPASGPGVMLH